MQVQLQRLADQQLIKAAVLAQDERIVQAGDQQDVVHAERHQVLEGVEQALSLRRGIGCWSRGGQLGSRLTNDSTCGVGTFPS